jgi:large subunit ribosomal protein L3
VQVVRSGEKDGYNAVQLGYDDVREKRVKKPQRQYLKSKNLKTKRFVREIRCAEAPDVKIGDNLTNRMLQVGDFIDVSGVSKGKGFQGGMKRCGWMGGPDTHGSMSHRAPGSMGASSYPSRVMKGHGGAGQMGNEKVTVQNLEVVDVDRENNTVAVKGAVPGANGTYLVIKYAKKKSLAPREVQPEEEAAEGAAQGEEEVKQEAAETKEEAGSKSEDENKG